MVVIEVVCNIVGVEGVGFEEFDYEVGEKCFEFVVYYLKEWVQGNVKVICKVDDDKGGIMWFGVYNVIFVEGFKVVEVYGFIVIDECYCYCYEVDIKYCEQLEKVGFKFIGMSLDGCLLEIVEW